MEEKEKRTIEEDANVYKVLAMLLEPVVAKEYEKMKADEQKVMIIPNKPNIHNECVL